MSIDRRTFVQSAAAAVGGATGVAADAIAQERLQVAQAPVAQPLAVPEPPPPYGGPWKPYTKDKEGETTQGLAMFLDKLFTSDIQGGTYRDEVYSADDLTLRTKLKNDLGIDLTGLNYATLRILIVDAENGRARFSDGKGCTNNATTPGVTNGQCNVKERPDYDPVSYWYTLILPPVPRASVKKDAQGNPRKSQKRDTSTQPSGNWHGITALSTAWECRPSPLKSVTW